MSQLKLDRFAILLSSICAIHCILIPIIVSLTPLLTLAIGHNHFGHQHFEHGHEIHDFIFHQVILLFIIPVSIVALISGYRSHGQTAPVITSVIGLIILTIVALFAEHLIHTGVIPYTGETLLTVMGGIIHATGHVMNVHAARKSHNCVLNN